jgi:type I restriction enzyme S subunit
LTIQGSIGRIAITQYDAYVDRTLLLFESFLVPIDNYYFAYAIFVLFEKEKERAPGGTIKTITKEKLSEFLLPLPSKLEQTSIAGAFLDIDGLIAKLEKLIEKKSNIKQGAMQELLTGKHRLAGFSGKWEVKKLGEIAQTTKGQGLSKGKLSFSGKYPCILYGELFTTYLEIIKDVYSKTDFEEGVLSKKGDILIPGSTTTTGIDLAKASALLSDNILLGGDINIIRKLRNVYDSIFLAYCLTHIYKNDIAQKTKGITIHHLQGKDLLDLEIVMPEEPEQVAIATVLSDMDTEIEKLESQLTKYQNIKQGMMQTLLTGKIRLLTK